MNPSTAILFNSPALHSLQRKQLISLCKRYRIKASGKNVDLISKLQAFGEQLPEDARIDPAFPLDDFIQDHCAMPATSSPVKPPRQSEPWEVLEGDSVEEVAMQIDGDEDTEGDGTVKKGTWKSAENGRSQAEGSAGEFGTRSNSSTSLSRSTSKSLKSFLSSGLSRSLSRNTLKSSKSVLDHETFKEPSPAPQSPEPGITKAMRLSIAGQEPTIRMVPPSPSSGATLYPELPGLSTPAPHVPTIDVQVPGGFPASVFPSSSMARPLETPSTSAFVFGSPRPAQPTTFNFKSPGPSSPATFPSFGLPQDQTGAPSMRAVMEEEMRKLMAEKGVEIKAKPVTDLFSRETYESLGGKKEIKKRRFDDIHEKEFSKLPSILDHYAARRPPSTTRSGQTGTAPRLSTTATPRRPRKSVAGPAAGGGRRQTANAQATARRPSALLSTATQRVRPAPASTSTQRGDESLDGRVTKKIKVDRPDPVFAQTFVPPSKPAPAPLELKSATTIPKSNSSRFGFFAQGVQNIKTFASGLGKPITASGSTSFGMPRSTSASSIPKPKHKVDPAPPGGPATQAKQFGFAKKEKPSAPAPSLPRSGSTLFAPTASSLARQAATPVNRKTSLTPSSSRPSAVLPARKHLSTASRVITKKRSAELKAARPAAPSNLPAPTPRRSPLVSARPSTVNPPALSKTPVKRGPQFKARVASKLSSQRGGPTLVGRTPGKQRSSISASLVHKSTLAGSSRVGPVSSTAAVRRKRESMPTGTSALRRHSSQMAGLKGRGRTSEILVRKAAVSTPKKKIIPKAPTTPFFPSVPFRAIGE